MNNDVESQRPDLEPEKLFEESTNRNFFGKYLFDKDKADYYRFSEDERGDSVWLVEVIQSDIYYEVRLVKDEDKFPWGKIIPRTLQINHVIKIDESDLEPYNRSKLEKKIREGGKSLARKANKAFIEVLEKSVQAASKIQTQGADFGSVVSTQYSILASKGSVPDVFVFPLPLQAILVQIGFIVRDQKINSLPYINRLGFRLKPE